MIHQVNRLQSRIPQHVGITAENRELAIGISDPPVKQQDPDFHLILNLTKVGCPQFISKGNSLGAKGRTWAKLLATFDDGISRQFRWYLNKLDRSDRQPAFFGETADDILDHQLIARDIVTLDEIGMAIIPFSEKRSTDPGIGSATNADDFY